MANMEKEVYIDIKSTQFADDEKDTTELFTFGKLLRGKEKDKYKIIYDESEATGFDGNRVILDVTGNSMVSLNRVGNANSNLIIEKGRKHHCHYGTPYGDFMIGITADEIKSDIDEFGGDLYLKYTIDINSSFMSENEMYISVKEKF